MGRKSKAALRNERAKKNAKEKADAAADADAAAADAAADANADADAVAVAIAVVDTNPGDINNVAAAADNTHIEVDCHRPPLDTVPPHNNQPLGTR